jgi:hypothetical protein
LSELDLVELNKKAHRIEIPQACIQETSLTLSMAPTRQPFHNIYTGQLSKKLMKTNVAIARINATNLSITDSLRI